MVFTTWLAFFAASWAISVSPGAGAVAAMSAGLNHGFARGYVLSLGLVLGIWTQVLVVGVGLGALIAASSLAFAIVKWLGVAYLVWLGIKQWRAPATPLVASADAGAGTSAAAVTRRTLFLRGWGVNAVNPKGTVFLLAVVPQFLDLGHALWPQYGVIALTLAFTDLVVMAGYTALASKLLRLLKTPAQMRVLNRAFGSLFLAVGALLATFRRS
jgi:homoserine/homoserine lactone efflux protein